MICISIISGRYIPGEAPLPDEFSPVYGDSRIRVTELRPRGDFGVLYSAAYQIEHIVREYRSRTKGEESLFQTEKKKKKDTIEGINPVVDRNFIGCKLRLRNVMH